MKCLLATIHLLPLEEWQPTANGQPHTVLVVETSTALQSTAWVLL